MSKLKILFNFNDTPDKEPVELNDFLQDPSNQKKMYDMRCLYLIRANMENKLTKLGIAGTEGGTGCYGRLRQYVLEYGMEKPGFDCAGAKLFLLVGTKYNKNVELKDSFVFKKELQLKKEFGSDYVNLYRPQFYFSMIASFEEKIYQRNKFSTFRE